MLRRLIAVGGIAVTETHETSQAALDRACARLSDALERIVDGLEGMPHGGETPHVDTQEIEALRNRVASLETEIASLRAAGRLAADGIGETIAALEAARR